MAGRSQTLTPQLGEGAKKAQADALASAKRQLRGLAKALVVALVVVWLLAAGFSSGLDTNIPWWVAAVLTVAAGIGAALVRRNLAKSEALGDLVAGGLGVDAEARASRIAKLEAKAAKGDAGALMAMAQLQMQDDPRTALTTLERIDLAKAQKLIAVQVRSLRAMLHLNLGEVRPARALVDDMDLAKVPDAKTRAAFAGVVAEAWARSGNPIEADELLAKYDESDKAIGDDARMQLLRARAFSAAHRNNVAAMRRALKALAEVSPQLLGAFVSQKPMHPLLFREARQRLERSGAMPRPKMQVQRR